MAAVVVVTAAVVGLQALLVEELHLFRQMVVAAVNTVEVAEVVELYQLELVVLADRVDKELTVTAVTLAVEAVLVVTLVLVVEVVTKMDLHQVPLDLAVLVAAVVETMVGVE